MSSINKLRYVGMILAVAVLFALISGSEDRGVQLFISLGAIVSIVLNMLWFWYEGASAANHRLMQLVYNPVTIVIITGL